MTDPEPVQQVLNRLHGVKKVGPDKWQAFCPLHENPPDGHTRSLSIAWKGDKVLFYCHSCGKLATPEIVRKLGLEMRDLGGSAHHRPAKASAPAQARGGTRRIETVYPYRDAGGRLLYEVLRYEPKAFRQCRPSGKGGWIWSLDGVRRVLYRLPELIAADPSAWVFLVEGEKDVDNVRGLGLVATCNPGGAGKWGGLSPLPDGRPGDSYLNGRRVAILWDRDKPKNGRVQGWEHAQDVAARLHGRTAVVKVMNLPKEVNSRRIKDVSGWIEAMDTRGPKELAAALVEMAEEAALWTPSAEGAARASGPVLLCLADVKPQPIRWLWPRRIAIGKLTLLVGDPDVGKSFLTLDMAARVTRGRGWPNCPDATAEPGGVVLLSAEDDLADTIQPRLAAAGTDMHRVAALTAVRVHDFEAGTYRAFHFDLTRDLAHLEDAIRKTHDCRLVILDPVSAYLGRTDSHRDAAIRGLLAPLAELAARCGVAVVAVMHLRKGEGPAMYRAMGSVGFVAAARAAYAVIKDKDDPTGTRRLMLPLKNNLSPNLDGLAYCIDSDGSTNGHPVVMWESEPVSISADEALASPLTQPCRRGPPPSERREAAEWLRRALADGPRPAKDLFRQAESVGISKTTLKRAKAELDVVAEKASWEGPWAWRLPEVSHEGVQVGPSA